KMDHVVLPVGTYENEICFVLTADTMSHDKTGKIQAKPVDRNDALAKIRAAREGSFLCTAYCLDKKTWRQGRWELVERIVDVVSAEFVYYVPEKCIEFYLENTPYLQV